MGEKDLKLHFFQEIKFFCDVFFVEFPIINTCRKLKGNLIHRMFSRSNDINSKENQFLVQEISDITKTFLKMNKKLIFNHKKIYLKC